MKNCAIICEYNPFHSGHKYQLDCVAAMQPQNIFCVMSGAFVQSALPAFCDKALRAECALKCGATAVIELPTIYATASAQYFAEGAIKIISKIKNISHIAMGAVGDSDALFRIAELKIKYSQRFSAILRRELGRGKSYGSASIAAVIELYDGMYLDKSGIDNVFTDPNNILCIEYITALNKLGAAIEPVIIKRSGAAYNELNDNSEHISATAIRSAWNNGTFDNIKRYIPINFETLKEYRMTHAADENLFKNMAVFALKRAKIEEIAQLRDCSEGMEYLLKSISDRHNFDEYIDFIVGKRYSKKRIYRLLLDILLSINKKLLDYDFCTRLLGCKKDFDFSLLPELVKTNNADIKRAAQYSNEIGAVLDIDIAATALYNTLCRIDGDYFNYSLVKI